MPDYDHAVTVNHDWLYKSVLLDALRNVVDLPFIMFFSIFIIRHKIRQREIFDVHVNPSK